MTRTILVLVISGVLACVTACREPESVEPPSVINADVPPPPPVDESPPPTSSASIDGDLISFPQPRPAPIADNAPSEQETSDPPTPAPIVVGADPPKDLARTTWNTDEYEFIFEEAPHAIVKGGNLQDLAPGGSPATYEYTDGMLRLEVLGREYEGHWNGEVMVIGGEAAIRSAGDDTEP